MRPAPLKVVSFNIWDLPYWFVKNREQRILQIAEYLQKLDAEIVCLQDLLTYVIVGFCMRV